MVAKSKAANSTMRIEGEFSIYRAAELKASLLTALNQTKELEIDLSAVNEIDTAGIQILVAIKKHAVATQKIVHLVAHSQAVTEVLELLNLVAYFGDTLVIASPSATGRNTG